MKILYFFLSNKNALMVNKSLNDIPYKIYFENFIPILGIKEIGILSMVSPTLNSMLSKNEFWKKLFLKIAKKRIVNKSVHIGPYLVRKIKHKQNGSIISLHQYNRINKTTYIDIVPEGYEFVKTDMFLGLLSPKSDILVDSVHSPPSCINKVRCREVLGLTSIIDRNDPSVQYGFTHNWYGWSSGGEYYYLNKHPPEIKQRYVDYLKNKGITTCSCFDHYDQTTLHYDGVYLDFKDFKKRIIKKLITENNKKIKSTERKYDKKRLQVERVKNRLKEVEKEENKLLEDVEKHKGLENKFKDALK